MGLDLAIGFIFVARSSSGIDKCSVLIKLARLGDLVNLVPMVMSQAL